MKTSIFRLHKNLIIYIFLICASFILLFPVLYMLANSFMSSREANVAYSLISSGEETGRPTASEENAKLVGFKLIPENVSFMQYYSVLLRKPKFIMMFWNSVIVTLPIVLGQLIVSSLAAFAFSKMRFPFRDNIFFIYIIVMMMPFQVTLVPNYIMIKQLGILGGYSAVILPGIFTTFGVFLLRQFMKYIPDEYCEAAKIDGAGYMRMFMQIVLPQCKGAMASLAILVFIDNWNMVEQPLIFLKDESMFPLSVFIARINTDDIGIAFACGILYMIPTILIFLYGENYFVEGIQLSGIK